MRAKTIGILGGVASGKTTMAAMLHELGAVVIDADQIAHRVLREPRVVAQVREQWGDDVLDPTGQVDRSKLGALVFQSAGQIEKLNAIVHPRVAEEVRGQREDAESCGASAVVLDAALLVEAGLRDVCDLLVFVDTPEAMRKALSKAQRGWRAHEAARREARQMPLDKKQHLADRVIRNDGSLSDLLAQVKAIWDQDVCGTD